MKVEELEKKLEPLFKDSGFEIVDIKLLRGKSLTLQIFIDKDDGRITLKDCELWSDKIAAFIDMNSIIDSSYVLEISSPGIDRIIKKPKDFEKFKGKEVKIMLKRPINGSRIYYSKIVAFKDGNAIFQDLQFSMDDIEEIRLNPSDDEILKDLKNY
ncbi:MAG: ribosome maturation factor RimP [Elusimicrobiales bacterium]|nr:ribosome maturation factor RimP [Elusimicrobiales bacterium]